MRSRSMSAIVVRLLVMAAVVVAVTLLARKRGYQLGADVLVRCSQGHVFTTIWIPGVSIKAVKLGPVRYQYCPVGRHWTLVRAVREGDLTEEEVRAARHHHDVRVP